MPSLLFPLILQQLLILFQNGSQCRLICQWISPSPSLRPHLLHHYPRPSGLPNSLPTFLPTYLCQDLSIPSHFPLQGVPTHFPCPQPVNIPLPPLPFLQMHSIPSARLPLPSVSLPGCTLPFCRRRYRHLTHLCTNLWKGSSRWTALPVIQSASPRDCWTRTHNCLKMEARAERLRMFRTRGHGILRKMGGDPQVLVDLNMLLSFPLPCRQSCRILKPDLPVERLTHLANRIFHLQTCRPLAFLRAHRHGVLPA